MPLTGSGHKSGSAYNLFVLGAENFQIVIFNKNQDKKQIFGE